MQETKTITKKRSAYAKATARQGKRKFKKGFLRLLSFISFLVLVGVAYLLNSKNIVHINIGTNNYWQNIKSFFISKEDADKDENIETPNDENEFITLFRSRLPSKNLEYASSSEIAANGDMKIFLKGTKNDTGYIYVNTNDRPDYVWITFVSAIDVEPLKTKLAQNLSSLDYFDLRFSNKIFYKFENGVSAKNDTKSTKIDNIDTVDLSTSSSTR